ncbi:hypothetical protein [Pseudomonas sp. FEN]|uniref:hypothetical protein n=1 Tax=Pseudomonas sp. FEN TaxID=2767468 RepID=UPI00174D0A43|nr:hypothetical protein [Pseudomonas sp. FEN]
MGFYQCLPCVKIFEENVASVPLCPFCRGQVIPYTGPTPSSLCITPLTTQLAPILPLPEVSPISFKFISLTAENVDFWRNYATLMRFIASNLFSGVTVYGYQQAVKGFMDALDCFKKTPSSQVWVAVATFGSIKSNPSARSFVNIEMCMTVTTHPDVPITTHMGIFRSPLRLVKTPELEKVRGLHAGGVSVGDIIAVLEKKRSLAHPVRRLSTQLHAFAAKRCLQESRGLAKIFMITAPLAKMLEILNKDCSAYSTEKIKSEKAGSTLVTLVGEAQTPKRHQFVVNNIQNYPWLTELTDLNGSRPKIAIEMQPLASAMDESTRVESVLDWLESRHNPAR